LLTLTVVDHSSGGGTWHGTTNRGKNPATQGAAVIPNAFFTIVIYDVIVQK
jgi:hypothetical protein